VINESTHRSVPRPLSSRLRWRRIVQNATLREILMGAQDNLTNVLAVVLGVTVGSGRADFVALAGLSAGIAEAVSMGGVLYNATRAERRAQARGSSPAAVAASDPRLTPAASGLVTFLAALVAGLIPLAPFALLPVSVALYASLTVSVAGLFALGSFTGRLGGDSWWREGLRLVAVAGVAAIAAALVGSALQVG
jgi:VIT1/CCC1 family predicted Fe2+/Mn2+ transporter